MTSALLFGAANSIPHQITPYPSEEEQGVRDASGMAPFKTPSLGSHASPRRVPTNLSAACYAADGCVFPSGSATSLALLRMESA